MPGWRALAALTLTLCLTAGVAASPADAATVVSLTFDDGQATQYQVRKPLRRHRMHGTFYVNSGQLCAAWCRFGFHMTWKQLDALAADGNEIGGHTLEHVDLTRADLSRSQKRRQVCADRRNLSRRGYHPVSFAYPFGRINSTAARLVRKCGYASARGAANTRRAAVESIPPRHPYRMRARGHTGQIGLATMRAEVRRAEARRGWVQLAFHGICSSPCGDGWVKPRTFRALLDWLGRRKARGTVVRTVRAVILRHR